MKNIVLVGFMGTGKSAVGKRLSERLGRPFVDLDERIEREAGRPIREIFAAEGEPAFRKREAEAVRRAAALEGHVIAAGGGVMTDEENVRRLKKNGLLVCLTARAEVILRRTSASRFMRPLLTGPDPAGRIEQLLTLRAASYAKADLTVDTSDRSVDEVVDEVARTLH